MANLTGKFKGVFGRSQAVLDAMESQERAARPAKKAKAQAKKKIAKKKDYGPMPTGASPQLQRMLDAAAAKKRGK